MAEENIPAEEPTSDDVDALRVVLYKVKGSSAVSTVPRPELADE